MFGLVGRVGPVLVSSLAMPTETSHHHHHHHLIPNNRRRIKKEQ
jgi:hypothetical protein